MRKLSLESAAGAGEQTNTRKSFPWSFFFFCAFASKRAGEMEHVVLTLCPADSRRIFWGAMASMIQQL